MFLTTEQGRRWVSLFAADESVDLGARLTGVAMAAYANENGEVEDCEEIDALVSALYVVCGIEGE